MQLFARDPNAGWLAVVERIVLALWVGGQCAVGYLAVPVLFHHLDRMQAGALAAPMFALVNWLGLGFGLFLLASAWMRRRSGAWPAWQLGALAVMLILIAATQFGLQPLMAELRAQAAANGGVLPPRFGQLHGISSVMYLVESLLGLALIAAHNFRRR